MQQKQLDEMLSLQESMNCLVRPDWREANWNWYRAIWLETAEAVEHTNWKWWKHTETDIDQLKLEMVDIWHFILSAHLQNNTPLTIENVEPTEFWKVETLPVKFESLVLAAIEEDLRIVLYLFLLIINDIGMTHSELYALYVGKNVLNRFRQDNGYKTGTYDKKWNGVEDNKHLMFVLENTLECDDIGNSIYKGLSAIYTARVAA